MTDGDAEKARGEVSRSSADGDLSGRLKRLGAELEARRQPSAETRSSEAQPSDPSSIGRAFRASSEFAAGVIAGGGIGWAIDRGLGTSPWGLIVFLMLGFAAGIVNVLRLAGSPTAGGGSGRRDGR